MKNTEVFHTVFFAFNSVLYSASSNKYLYRRFLSCLGVISKGPSQVNAKRKAFSFPLYFFSCLEFSAKML